MSSRDKLKTYFHHHNAYGHKTYQFGDTPWNFQLVISMTPQ